MDRSLLDSIKDYLGKTKAVKFAYLFGSHAKGRAGPLSDIDLGVYLDNRFDFFTCRLRLLEEVSQRLKGLDCDLIVLNNAPLILQYEVIREGIVLKEDKPRRVQFETHVLRHYLDTEEFRSVHVASLKRGFAKEQNLGQ